MNFHSDDWIMDKIKEHYAEALEMFPESRIVGIFCQGSQNYGLDVENSDIDTKLIVTPTFDDLAYVRKPVSTTHIRQNEEHIDLKDVRLYIETFRKQNLNFVEILFTPYCIINPKYADIWQRLIDKREAIARYSEYRAIKTMKGIAMEKYHAIEHRYPSKIEILDKWGYDPKQLHHLYRVESFMRRYISHEPYANCLIPSKTEATFFKLLKTEPVSLETARAMADAELNLVNALAEYAEENYNADTYDVATDNLLKQVQRDIMYEALKEEFK